MRSREEIEKIMVSKFRDIDERTYEVDLKMMKERNQAFEKEVRKNQGISEETLRKQFTL